MKQDSIKYLPQEIVTNILSRLDVRAVASSKCVCKPWLDLLETDEFVKLHFSRSATALAILTMEENSGRFTVFELEDKIDVESSHDHHYNHPIKFSFLPNTVRIEDSSNCMPLPNTVKIEGSSTCMLFLERMYPQVVYVCNPITREYIELHRPRNFSVSLGSYGFGESKASGQHKVVRISVKPDCHVYTLGTGSWRRVDAPSASFTYGSLASGALVNGSLHWIVYDSDRTMWTSCFDLETECFSTFSIPAVGVLGGMFGLSVLRDCLCACDHKSENEIVLWLMKDYGDDKSWTKEYVINLTPPDFGRDNFSYVYPVNAFKDGDVLMLWNRHIPVYYSNKTKSIQEIGVLDAGKAYNITSRLFTPSFLSLKIFPMENVLSF